MVRVLLAVTVFAAGCAAPARQSEVPARACEQVGQSQFLQAVPEASGIALANGVLWTLNDSDAPVLYSIDRSGRPAPVTVAGADVRDWEDLAAGPCPGFAEAPAGECLYIADIGDNRESRERITIYEIPVPPAGSTSTTRATATHLRYPDGPHDAEALLVTKRIGIFVITKEIPARVYRVAERATTGGPVALIFERTLNEKARITGGAVSPDERWVALRSNSTLLLYTLDDFAAGGNPVRVDLRSFNEPQGEGVAFGSDADLYLVSEGGGKNAAGVLTRIHCAFLR